MDQTDIKIMNLLQEDCKTTTREIGRRVGLSAPAVSERVARLRENGAIRAFRAKLNPAAVNKAMAAYVVINVPPEHYARFCDFVQAHPAVVEHHHIIGPNNALLRLQVADSGELERCLAGIRAFGLSNTSVVLNTYFDQKPL